MDDHLLCKARSKDTKDTNDDTCVDLVASSADFFSLLLSVPC